MSVKIIEALKRLDPAVDDHWTADGLPKLDKIGEGVKRADVTAAAPHFKRDNVTLDTPASVKAAAEATKPLTLEEQREIAVAALSEATKEAAKVRKVYDKAIADLDFIERQIADKTGKRGGQADIMDYLAAQKRRREELAQGG